MTTRLLSFQRLHQDGLTLIELLVALVMGLVILAGVVTVFVANKQTYKLQDVLARLQENGRFSLAILERDIRMAGFEGCKNLTIRTNTVNTSGGGSCPAATPTFDGGEPVDGFDNVTGDPSGLDLTPNPKSGTDVLRLLLGGGQGAKVIHHHLPAAELKVTAHADLTEGDIVLVVDSNCENGSVFQITNFAGASGHHSEVVHNTGTGAPGNCTKDLVQTYVGGSIYKIDRAVYYVGGTGRFDALGGEITALYLRRGVAGASQELVEGVEDFQVLYGVGSDGDGDGVDEQITYWTADKVPANGGWAKVVTVRTHLLLRSTDPNALYDPVTVAEDFNINVDKTATDPEYHNTWTSAGLSAVRNWRQVYATTVTVRNRVP